MAFKRMRLNPDTGKTWPKKPKRNRNDFLFVTKRREFSCFMFLGSSKSRSLTGGDSKFLRALQGTLKEYQWQVRHETHNHRQDH